MPDVKLSLPIDAADHVLGMIGMPQPNAPGPRFGPDMPPPDLSDGPLGSIAASSGGPAMPALPGRVTPMPTASLGAPMTAPPRTTAQKVGGALGKIGGVALDALAPGIAEQIPQTPLGRIAEQKRNLEASQIESQNELRGAQAEAAREKAPTAEEIAALRGAQTSEVQGQKDKTAEDVAGVREKTAENVQDARGKTAEAVQGAKGKTAEDIASGKNNTAEDIATQRVEAQKAIAKGHDLVSTENERIRAASANDPDKLTNTMKTMKQQAQSTLPQIDKALDETEAVATMLGPTAGRWNDFWQGKVGAPDPKFAHYKDEISMVSTAVTLAHARGRMSNELFEHFQQMFDAGKQSPENMIQALNVAREWLDGYAKMGDTAPANGGAKGNAPPAGAKVRDYTQLGAK